MAQEVRQRATSAVLRNAIFSWQTAVTLLVTVILFFAVPNPFSFWQAWFWLVLGGMAEAAFIISTLTDPEVAEEVIAKAFEQNFDITRIRNRVSRERLRDALEYRRTMMELVSQAKGALKLHLSQTVSDIDDWIAHMYDIARHIDSFEDNELVERDRRTVPQQLEKTRFRMEREQDPAVRRDLERQVHNLEQQLANLEATASSVRRAEIQLESTLSSLGTVYAQMSLLGTKEVDSARAQRLRLEIQDEVSSLQDTIEAMDEVQAQSLRLR
jgi:hypothetical protein